MKKFLYLAVTAAMAAAVLSCDDKITLDSDSAQNGSELREMSFIAGMDDENTKVQMNDNLELLWNDNDAISVFRKKVSNNKREFVTSLESPSKTATFTGSIEALDGDDDCYYGIFPNSEYNSYYKADPFLEANLETWQRVKAGTFDQNAAMYAGVAESSQIPFRNVCSFLRFSVTNSDIDKVTLHSDSKMLSGPCQFFFDNNSIPVFKEIVNRSYYSNGEGIGYNGGNDIIVIPADYLTHAAPFIQGSLYYVVIPPGQYDDLEIRFHNADGAVATRKLSTFTLKRNDIVSLKQADAESKLTTGFSGGELTVPELIPGLCNIHATNTYHSLQLRFKASHGISDPSGYSDDVLGYRISVNGYEKEFLIENHDLTIYGDPEEIGYPIYETDVFKEYSFSRKGLDITIEAIPANGFNSVTSEKITISPDNIVEFSASQNGCNIVLQWPGIQDASGYDIIYDDNYSSAVSVGSSTNSITLTQSNTGKNFADGQKHKFSVAAKVSSKPRTFSSCSFTTTANTSNQLAPAICKVDHEVTNYNSMCDAIVTWNANHDYVSNYKVSFNGGHAYDAGRVTYKKVFEYMSGNNYFSYEYPEGDDNPNYYTSYQWYYDTELPYEVRVIAVPGVEGYDEAQCAAVITLRGSNESGKSIIFMPNH